MIREQQKPQMRLKIYKEDIKAYSTLQRTYDTQMRQVYNVIWGQCTVDMESKIRTHDKYKEIDQGGTEESDPVSLLQINNI